MKAFCTTETSQVFTTLPPSPPYHTSPCHRAFVLPLPLPRCLIYKQLPKYSKIAVLVKSTDRISHTFANHDFTNSSIASLQTGCRPTHTLIISTGHVCLKPSKASLLWFHSGCTTYAPRAISVDFTVQGHDCLMLCVKDEPTTRLGLNACRLDPALPN